MGVLNDVGAYTRPPPPPAGRGLLLDDDGNPDFVGKRLTEVGEPEDDGDVVTKTFLEDQFTPVMMTRNVFSQGISMQGGRIEGLPNPVSEADATTKSYVDGRINIKNAYLERELKEEDAKLQRLINQGDMYRSVRTKNMLDLKSEDFVSSDFSVFAFGQAADFTQKYHNATSHVICSLNNNSGRLLVNLGEFKRGKYGVRVEAMIDPKDDESSFDVDVATVNTGLITTISRYREKIDPHAIAMDLEIETKVDTSNLNIALVIHHVPAKEIAMFFFGRRGEGHVDPMIIDNINYYEKIKIPEYKSFTAMDRRKSIGITNTILSEVDKHPIVNLLADSNHFSQDSRGAFRFGSGHNNIASFQLYFPCLVSIFSVRFTQKTNSNHGLWMIRCFDEKRGYFIDLISSRGFQWREKDFTISLNDNVGKVYLFALIQGSTTPNVDILPLIINTQEAFF